MSERAARDGVVGALADIAMIRRQLAEVVAVASDPDRAGDDERIYDLRIGWGVLLAGRLQRLAYYHGRRELSAAQSAGYAELLAELAEALPLIDRLGLDRPPVPPPAGPPKP